jgi:hypothetical protein
MIKAKIDEMILLLEQAKEKGCERLKLQLYEDWNEIQKEQRNPSLPIREYMIDTRFYNTIEFDTEVKDNIATEKIRTHISGDTLVIQSCLSDMESLLSGLDVL